MNIHDLRISITDRCNYKCVYCRSGNDGPAFPEMPIADYLRMVRVFVRLGITKVRLTGGEPLLRRGLVEMVRELRQMRTLAGRSPRIAITTNGHLLADLAQATGRCRTLARDSLHGCVEPIDFARITRVPSGYERVLAGIRAAQRAELKPVKVNCVLLHGFNHDQIAAFGNFARENGVAVRFIEFMPLEEDRIWSPDIVITLRKSAPHGEVHAAAADRARAQRDRSPLRSRRWNRRNWDHRAVSQPFCGACGAFASPRRQDSYLPVLREEHDLAGLMSRGASDEELSEFIIAAVDQKEARHHIGEPGFAPASRTMVHIGG